MPSAIIVEDEPHLRAELRDHLAMHWPELQILAEAENGIEAIQQIGKHQPDIVFLDIQIPGINGLDLVSHIPETAQVVFVTAYAEYAVKAFEAGAADYLLKPIDATRLATTVRRLKLRAANEERKPIGALWQQLAQGQTPSYLKWIKASLGETVRLIMVEEVMYFNASEKYTRVVAKNAEALIRLTLKNLLEQLDPAQFAQIHRSTIVNLQAIDRIERMDGSVFVYLRGRSERLPVSEAFVKQFRQM